MDMGDERQGLRLPGVRTDHGDGSFDVEYDIPLAFFDCRLDDGVTRAQGHPRRCDFPDAKNPSTHPEWWGKTFYKHFPNHGFVGDIFTVNGTAYPVLEVKRRKYRFRFLDASMARIYDFKLMSSTQGPKTAGVARLQGRRARGPVPHPRRPAVHEVHPDRLRRRAAAVPDPSRLVRAVAGQAPRGHHRLHPLPGRHARPPRATSSTSPTSMKMPDGRMWANSSRFSPDPNYKVPVLKFVIGDDAPTTATCRPRRPCARSRRCRRTGRR